MQTERGQLPPRQGWMQTERGEMPPRQVWHQHMQLLILITSANACTSHPAVLQSRVVIQQLLRDLF